MDRKRIWLGVAVGIAALIAGSAVLPAADGDQVPNPNDPHHCEACGEHLSRLKQRFQLYNAVVSLDRRNRGDDDHNAYRNVLRLDTDTGRAWILRPNDNVAGFSWVLVNNYD
jgi:hypothetical protein